MTELWKPTRTSRLWKRGDPAGLPMNGLIALWDPYRDTYGRNVLPVGAETFSVDLVEYKGAVVTVTPGQPDPDGGNNAYRIQTTGGASTIKCIFGSFGNTVLGVAYKWAIWGKTGNGSTFKFQPGGDTQSPNADWGGYSIASRGIGGLMIDMLAPAVGDNLDLVLYHPQLNLGSTLFPYSTPAGAPGALQAMGDYCGGLYPLQLGSGATGDASDPAFTGVSMLHAADYLISGNLAGITMAGDWTLPFLCKPSGTANVLVSLASAAAADQYQAVEYNGSTKVRIKTVNGATVTTSGDLTVSATTVQMLVLTSSGDTLTLKRMDTGTSVTATNADPAGTPRLCVGALGVSTVATPADALEWHLLPLYGRAWTAGEEMRAYVYAKSLMARRGVTLA